ncbi:MAG: adaptor protein MecA [Clostridia bacterium]|nr:adaptor protein MecA [Clostridia bacterium]
MTAEIINNTKMKVTLLKSDLCRFNITFQELMQSEAQAKYVLQQILYETKWSGDFLADSPPLLIEMLMYKELCVIYFIKVKRRPLKIKGAAYTVLKFESAEDMLCCFDKLYNHPCMNIKSSLYAYGGKYYLSVALKYGHNKKVLGILSEFATDKCRQNPHFYAEHGVLIFKNQLLNAMGELFFKGK